jgi:chorismate mutase / prephenate dehydratase
MHDNEVTMDTLKDSINDKNNEKVWVGYQGVEGSYSHEALLDYFQDNVDTVNFNEFEEVFKNLKSGKIKYGVLPVENSSTGGISEVMDFLHGYDAFIVGEKCLKINHNLLGIKGAKFEDIEEVYSHPQGFLQCSDFLKKYPNLKTISYYNTAMSVEFVKKADKKGYAAIASKKAAELYGVDIIKSSINTNTNNYTRFVIISNEMEVKKDSNKISVVLSLPHTQGSLYKIIKCIADRNLNMLKIESRPIANVPWQYLFYMDFEGNLNELKVKEALECIKLNSIQCKVLGNYLCDQNL